MNNFSSNDSHNAIPAVNEFPRPLTIQTALNVLHSKYVQYTDRVCKGVARSISRGRIGYRVITEASNSFDPISIF